MTIGPGTPGPGRAVNRRSWPRAGDRRADQRPVTDIVGGQALSFRSGIGEAKADVGGRPFG